MGWGWRFTLILICLISDCVWLCLLLTRLILELTDERKGSVEGEKRQVSKSEPKPQKRTITGGFLDLIVVVVVGVGGAAGISICMDIIAVAFRLCN